MVVNSMLAGDRVADSNQPESEGGRSGIQVIARAAKILRSLEHEQDGLSLGEIAARVELPRSTVQRIVAALAEERLVRAASPNSRVKLGPALIRLAKSATNDISAVIKPVMEELSRELHETVDLSFLQGPDVVFIEQVLGNRRLRAVSAIGERFPAHCTANGKALLATLSDEKLSKFLNRPLDQVTPNTLVNADTLRSEILRIRTTGISYDMEEHTDGVCAIGTVFEDLTGQALALSVPIPTPRFAPSRSHVETLLLRYREVIKGKLGEDSLH
jgi:DNA-binding IclR family transcriptional regulator